MRKVVRERGGRCEISLAYTTLPEESWPLVIAASISSNTKPTRALALLSVSLGGLDGSLSLHGYGDRCEPDNNSEYCWDRDGRWGGGRAVSNRFR